MPSSTSCTSARSGIWTATAWATSAGSSRSWITSWTSASPPSGGIQPFYPSPGRDDGYDIADYRGVDPLRRGWLRDARRFVTEAHRRGLKVITELVCNHTSDQHAWFQASRRARPGTRDRNRYVWSDTPDRYRGTRIIFGDFETSQLDLGPRRGCLLLAPLLQPPAGSQLRRPARPSRPARRRGFLARRGRGRTATRCHPVPLRARGQQLREPARDARVPEDACAATSTSAFPVESFSRRPISGPRRRSRTSAKVGAMSATWPSTSRSCRAFTWHCGARTGSPSWTSWPRRPRSPRPHNGGCSCATTTS